MTDYTVQPGDLVTAQAAERALWEANDEARYIGRRATRKHEAGDISDDELAAARKNESAVMSDWHKSYNVMQDMLRTALTERGFDVATVVRIAKSMS